MENINQIIFLLLAVFCTSCFPFNRMTSPEVLDEDSRSWNVGIAVDPQLVSEETYFAYQPVFGYRLGLKNNQDVGINLYGVYFPGATFDYKKNLIRTRQFFLTGDVALAYRLPSEVGGQFDLLFGNKTIYGVTGATYGPFEYLNNDFNLVLGIGSQFTRTSPLGLQVAYHGNYWSKYPENYLSIGLYFNFEKKRKKYRNK